MNIKFTDEETDLNNQLKTEYDIHNSNHIKNYNNTDKNNNNTDKNN